MSANASAAADATPKVESAWRAAASNTPMLAAEDGIAWAYVVATSANAPLGQARPWTTARSTIRVEASSTAQAANDQASTVPAARAERSGSSAAAAVRSVCRRRSSGGTFAIRRLASRCRAALRARPTQAAATATVSRLSATSQVRAQLAGIIGAIASVSTATVKRSNRRSSRIVTSPCPVGVPVSFDSAITRISSPARNGSSALAR